MLKSKEFERHMIMCMRRVVLGLNSLNLIGELTIWCGVWIKIHQIWPNNLLSNLFFGWNPQNLTKKFVFRVWCKPYCSIWSENFLAIQCGQITFFVVRSCSCSFSKNFALLACQFWTWVISLTTKYGIRAPPNPLLR